MRSALAKGVSAQTYTASSDASAERDNAGIAEWLVRERLTLLVPVLLGALYLAGLRNLFSQDGWLALVAGREIAQHGLPQTEHLTVFSHGERWVDQQWLAQLAMYGVHQLGGVALLALLNVALAMATVGVAVFVSRRNGAPPRAVALVGVVAVVPLSFVLATVRTQVFGAVAFAIVLGLLICDARALSRRVWLVLPVLLLWTNLHGSVLLGVGVVALRGLTIAMLPPRRGKRGAALAVGGIAMALASPYVGHLPAYYRHTAFNPQFAKFVGEWRPATPSVKTALFYVLIGVAIWGLARRRRRTSTFEQLVLLATAVAGIAAVRNAGFFAIAALMIVPATFEQQAPSRPRGRAGIVVAVVPLVLLAALAVSAVARMQDWIQRAYPPGLAHAVERVVLEDPGARVFADVRFADWLLWRQPRLAGQVAFDARYELLTSHQIEALHRFNDHRDPGWQSAAKGYRIVVLDEEAVGPIARALLRRPGARLAYGSDRGTVVELPRG